MYALMKSAGRHRLRSIASQVRGEGAEVEAARAHDLVASRHGLPTNFPAAALSGPPCQGCEVCLAGSLGKRKPKYRETSYSLAARLGRRTTPAQPGATGASRAHAKRPKTAAKQQEPLLLSEWRRCLSAGDEAQVYDTPRGAKTGTWYTVTVAGITTRMPTLVSFAVYFNQGIFTCCSCMVGLMIPLSVCSNR